MNRKQLVGWSAAFSLVLGQIANGQSIEPRAPSELIQGYKVDALFCHLIEGKPKEQCFGNNADLQENVDQIDAALLKLDGTLGSLGNDDVDAVRAVVKQSVGDLGAFLQDCANAAKTDISTADAKTCVEETAEEVTTAYRDAVEDARKACEKVPDDQLKATCNSAVETFSEEADEGIAKLVQAAGPVLAFCAVSAGTGCVIMAVLAILQLFMDSGGSGSGSGNQGPGTTSGQGGEDARPPAPAPENIMLGDDFDVENFGTGIKLVSSTDATFSFTIDGYSSGASYTARSGGEVAELIAVEINEAGSVGSYIAGKNEKFSVGIANDNETGITICVEDLPAFNVTPDAGQTGLEIFFLPGSEVSAQSADACP
ncbi:MAG: hypothetical protein ABJ375_01875 [Rhizobiaceae bacterium]